MKKRNAPGELELKIQHELQKMNEASVSDLEHQFQGEYAYTTIMTVLSRMYTKGIVERFKVGKQYRYKVKTKHSFSLLNRIKKRVFGNNTAGMVQYLIESSKKLSLKELEELEKLLEKCKHE